MALKLVVDSLEGVDEAHKALYTEDNGKFRLQVDGVEDTSGLKTALSQANKEAAERRKQLETWKRFGKSPDEIEELIEAQKAAEEAKAEKAGEWDKLKAQMNEQHSVAIKAKDETIAQYRRRLEAELVDAKATAAIAAAKGVPDLLLPIVQRHVKVDENFNVTIVDAAGTPRVDGKGEPLRIADLVSELRASEIYGRAFEGSGQSGGGMPPTGGNGANPGRIKSQADVIAPAKGDKNLERKLRAAFIEAAGDNGQAWLSLPKV